MPAHFRAPHEWQIFSDIPDEKLKDIMTITPYFKTIYSNDTGNSKQEEDPSSFENAMENLKWWEVMDKDPKALTDNVTCDRYAPTFSASCKGVTIGFKTFLNTHMQRKGCKNNPCKTRYR